MVWPVRVGGCTATGAGPQRAGGQRGCQTEGSRGRPVWGDLIPCMWQRVREGPAGRLFKSLDPSTAATTATKPQESRASSLAEYRLALRPKG
eukprot:2746850-Prymnesium_polylepis.1